MAEQNRGKTEMPQGTSAQQALLDELERLRRERDDLEKLRQEKAAQEAELDQLRQEKAQAEADARRAKEDAEELSRRLDEEVARTERDIVRQLHAQRKVRILIPSGRNSHDRAPVIVGVNGREFLIERDKEVVVPEGVVNVLNLAKEKVPLSSFDQSGQQSVRFDEAQRIPFQILGYVEPTVEAGK